MTVQTIIFSIHSAVCKSVKRSLNMANNIELKNSPRKSIVGDYYDTVDEENPRFLRSLESQPLKNVDNKHGRKIYTELLCNRKYIDSYVQKTTRTPVKGSGSMRGFFRSCYHSVFKKSNIKLEDDELEADIKPSERARRHSIAEDRWHAGKRLKKMIKYFFIIF